MSTIIALTILWLAHFIVDFMLGIWSVYKTMSFLDLGIAGIIASLCGFFGEGAQIFFGPLSDRGYRTRLIVLGVIFTSANVLLAYTGNYFLLFLFYLFTCLGSGAFHPSAVAYIGNLTERQKALFISIFASGGALGMAISQLTFSKTYQHFEGHTLPILIPSALMMLIFFYYGFFQKNSISPGVIRPKIGLAIFKLYFKDKNLRMLYLTQVFNQTIFWGTIFLLPDVLVSRGYGDEIAFGGGHMAFIIGSAFTMIPCGYFADRFSVRNVIVLASFLGMISYYVFLMMPGLDSSYVLIALLFAGSFMGIVQPLAVSLGTILGKNNPGLVSAFTMGLVWCVSESIGPLGAGLLTKLFNEDAPAKALMIYGLFFPLLIWSASKLPQPQYQEAQREINQSLD